MCKRESAINFDGFQPHEFNRWSSLVEQDDPTALPTGVAVSAHNVTFHKSSVRTRDGIQQQFQTTDGKLGTAAVTGLIGLTNEQTSGTTQVPVIWDTAGKMYKESPIGSGTLAPITSSQVAPPASLHMISTQAYNRGYFAFSDLITGKYLPAVYDLPTGVLDPFSMRPFGERWKASTAYQLGEVVTPTTGTIGNGHTYRCTTAGTSGAVEPAFPLGDGATINDGTAVWTEQTAHAGAVIDSIPTTFFSTAVSAGAGTYAAGRDIYIAVTIKNGNGESVLSAQFKARTNSVLNDRIIVTIGAAFPSWLTGLIAPFAAAGVEVYAADVATAAAAPATTAYHKIAGGPYALAATVNVDASGAGAAPPTANGATITTASQGNICSGIRYMVVLFKNRNGYITGMTEASVITLNIPGNAQQLWVGNIPKGPANTAARILCFTVAGGATVGDYFYIPSADSVSGVSMSATAIADNTTTSGIFNFTDVYLLSATKVTSFFRKIQAPNAVDICFSESLGRMVLTDGVSHYISLSDDPESFYGDTGILTVGQLGQGRALAWREFKGSNYSLKESAGYLVEPNTSDPSKWNPILRWTGKGPCGPRAVFVAADFMVFVHRSGAYVFFGDSPQRISTEIPQTWERINWDHKELIWVQVDEERKEVRIGVPFDQSPVPDKILKCNYEESPEFALPIYFSHFSGKYVASTDARKWSIDDIPAYVCARVERKVTSADDGGRYSLAGQHALTRQSQIMFGSSSPEGSVNAITPGIFNDNGFGIDSEYETTSPQEMLKIHQMGGVAVNADGAGDLRIQVVFGRAQRPSGEGPSFNVLTLMPINLSDAHNNPPKGVGARGQNERLRLRFSNGAQPDSWFDLKYAALYARPAASAR